MKEEKWKKDVRAAARAIAQRRFLEKIEADGSPLDVDEMADMMTDFVADLFDGYGLVEE